MIYIAYNFTKKIPRRMIDRKWESNSHDSSVIRQKGECQNGGNKKAKRAKFSKKNKHFYPLIRKRVCAYQRVRNVRFSENLACFAFLLPPFWDSPFCLITDELEMYKVSLCASWFFVRMTHFLFKYFWP